MEAEEADGRRDDIDFEGDRDAVVALLSLDNPGGGDATSPLNNVVIKEGGDAEAEEEDGGRDDNDFEGGGNNLGWGKEETTLTDGAMDPGGNVGANNGSTEDEDEIGLIFDLEGKETKVCLRDIGSYVKFSKECRHKGYKSGSVNTYLSAQLFSAPTGKEDKCKTTWQSLRQDSSKGSFIHQC